ncbi:hypothetical protein [Rhizohabitans arisaemae]|uniref:hypothetical protein n=1 Tax=Rhizohabitans arisaemae TaxID=2720610 RepID=UPI0024B0495E|nr:hypothetical protein [Rhizohabitans arisaemae]
MRMWKPMLTCTVAALAVTALHATPAAAARGSLTLVTPTGAAVVLRDPAPGCHTSAQPFTGVANRTDTFVTAYADTGCSGPSQVVVPQPGTVAVGVRRSVAIPR